jgi:hypothetical protein
VISNECVDEDCREDGRDDVVVGEKDRWRRKEVEERKEE